MFEEKSTFKILRLIIGIVLFGLSFLVKYLNFGNSLYFVLLISSYLILGFMVFYNTVVNISKKEFFDENFLMFLSTVGAFILKEYTEAVFVMLLYSIGEYFQDLAVDKSKDKIKKLLDLKPKSATLILKDNETMEVNPKDVGIGSLITVYAGDIVPIDGILINSSSVFDTKSLTGESTPRYIQKNEEVLSGFICTDGQAIIKTTKEFKDSSLSRIFDLIEKTKENKAPTESFITSFSKIYTPSVVLLAVLTAIIPSLITGTWNIWTYRALNFLIISCPCALVLSVPLTFYSGLGKFAKHGILAKGAVHLQNLSKTQKIIFDKTGTLTTGQFKVKDIVNYSNIDIAEILQIAYTLELSSNHPIALAISSYCKNNNIRKLNFYNIKEIKGRGIEGYYENTLYSVVKSKEAKSGIVSIYKGNEILADVLVEDNLKDNAKITVKELKKMGYELIMLTGDGQYNADKTAEELGIINYKFNMMPDEKLSFVKEIGEKSVCAYVGDGINDSPVLLCADIGISMGALGSEEAINSSGIVITDDNLEKIPLSIRLSKKTMKLAKENIFLALLAKSIVLILSILGLSSMSLSVFADTGIALLCVLNAIR